MSQQNASVNKTAKQAPIIITARPHNSVAAIVYDPEVAARLMSTIRTPSNAEELDSVMVVVSNKQNGMSCTVPVRVAAVMLGLDLPKNGKPKGQTDDHPA